ncbi:hypothetical protein IPU62_00345 [Pseudogracilibacillus auburnensis]|nr:hypothetical protein [Pseudogracilibacillus auburnensis]MBO1001139.1 hypothetical protein [Pseudogracilibacillus auburnensis]
MLEEVPADLQYYINYQTLGRDLEINPKLFFKTITGLTDRYLMIGSFASVKKISLVFDDNDEMLKRRSFSIIFPYINCKYLLTSILVMILITQFSTVSHTSLKKGALYNDQTREIIRSPRLTKKLWQERQHNKSFKRD